MTDLSNLGKLAYDAYCETTDWKSAISGAPLPKWEAQAPKIQAAWNAGAFAVARYLGVEGTHAV